MSERKHRHITETGLTLLFHSKAPTFLWVEAFATAVYLINRLPSPVLKNNTPFSTLYGTQPDYSSLRPFGCLCYPYLRDYGTKKLSPKSYPCVFVGYSDHHKGFRCLQKTTRRLYISRHVVFDERRFPYPFS